MKIFINVIIIALVLNYGIFPNKLSQERDSVSSSNTAKFLQDSNGPLIVRKCKDFSLTGGGGEIEWKTADWRMLTKLDSGGNSYKSRFKILYSERGIYVLFNGEDEKITTQANQDFGTIYNGDAFEIFFHPNPKKMEYFEYEINQLNKILILMISRKADKSYSWIPWHYENGRQMNTMVDIEGGKMEAGGNIQSWSAEAFFPFGMFGLLDNVPPESGTVWNANFCRLDYDTGQMVKWSWSPKIKSSFHELDKFFSIKFE